jgi:ABC-type transport system substrate-binding protein
MDADNPVGARGRSTLGGLRAGRPPARWRSRCASRGPNGAFIFNLALANAYIASPGALEGDVPRNPVGTGPFRFGEWRDGEYVLVERYDGYWGEPAAVEAIRFLVVNNAATRVAMLEAGEVDWAEEIPPALVPTHRGEPRPRGQVGESTFARIFPMNTQRPPFDDVRVRQALNYAVDKEQLAMVVFRGYATVMDAALPRRSSATPPSAPTPTTPSAPARCWPRPATAPAARRSSSTSSPSPAPSTRRPAPCCSRCSPTSA